MTQARMNAESNGTRKTREKLRRISAWLSVFALSFLVFAVQAHAADCAEGALCNPLHSDFDSIPKFIAGALKVVVMIALPIITLFFVVVGYKFISAQGNSGKIDEAKKNFVYVTIGAFLIMGAWVIATLIAGTVTELVS